MKAVYTRKFGSPAFIDIRDVGIPVPGDNEALVKVRAASINGSDIEWMKGMYFARFMGSPKRRILGSEMSGVVTAVGNNVQKVKPGDAVLADLYSFGMGAFADYVAVDAGELRSKPDGLSFQAAATLPEAGISALQGLKPLGIKNGDTVLINGAGGGIGSFAVQLAKHDGAVVTAVDRSDKEAFMRSMGADFIVDYTKQDYTTSDQKYDYILDLHAVRRLADYRRLLRPGGRFIMAGGRFSLILRTLAADTFSSKKDAGVLMWKTNDENDINELVQMALTGTITPAIDRVYPLDSAAEALQYCWTAEAKGKVVFTMDE